MKESHKKTLGNLQAGLVKLLKIIWIILKSFFEAITWDFINNIKKYWKKTFKKHPKEEQAKTHAPVKKAVPAKEPPKQPLP